MLQSRQPDSQQSRSKKGSVVVFWSHVREFSGHFSVAITFMRKDGSFFLKSFDTNVIVSLPKILREASTIINDAENIQREIDDAKRERRRPNVNIPQPSFERNELNFVNYRYQNSGRMLWKIKEEDYSFWFAVNIET